MHRERGQKYKEGTSGSPREAAVDKEAGFGGGGTRRQKQRGRSGSPTGGFVEPCSVFHSLTSQRGHLQLTTMDVDLQRGSLQSSQGSALDLS